MAKKRVYNVHYTPSYVQGKSEPAPTRPWRMDGLLTGNFFILFLFQKKPEKGREAAAPSNIKEIQEIQGGQEAPLDGDAINPKDA